MNINELNDIIAKETGVSICPICGTPFEKYHYRQVTCGTDECRKAHRAKYMRERKERLMEEDIDMWRQKRNAIQRKHRRKKKGLNVIDDNLKKAQEYWERREKALETDKPDGKGYAEKQVARTLSQVPKIDVSGFGKERKE